MPVLLEMLYAVQSIGFVVYLTWHPLIKMNLIIGVTGSVASIKLDLLIKNFQSAKLDVKQYLITT